MSRRWVLLLVAANLIGLTILTFIWPHLMVGPGSLMPAHAALASDCFACHAPLRGASSGRCTVCHAPADIGLRDSGGAPIPNPSTKVSFHQQLIETDCVACHSDHFGPRLTQRARKPFSHGLLRADARKDCATCHAAPVTAVHGDPTRACTVCHSDTAWKPASFDHASLVAGETRRCESCHAAPSNKLHERFKDNCGRCHSTDAWEPARFEHSALPAADLARCESCHAAPADPLHARLKDNCGKCHSQQAWEPATFKHSALPQAEIDRCESCHAAPTDTVHALVKDNCGKCHSQEAWEPANFEHAALPKAELDRCEACHSAPADKVHRRIKGGCGSCHGWQSWSPVSFDHDTVFRIKGPHNAACVKCHVGEDYSRYTCYGCHRHTPANVRREHLEEGITNYENCVECHRSTKDARRTDQGAREPSNQAQPAQDEPDRRVTRRRERD